MRMHNLSANKKKRWGYLMKHELSLFIKCENDCILFDIDQPDIYPHNTTLMGMDLNKDERIVISQGQCGHSPKIHMKKGFFIERHVLDGDSVRHTPMQKNTGHYNIRGSPLWLLSQKWAVLLSCFYKGQANTM